MVNVVITNSYSNTRQFTDDIDTEIDCPTDHVELSVQHTPDTMAIYLCHKNV